MASALKRCAVAIAAVACAISGAEAGIVEGSYRGSETWIYLDRFVFYPVKDGEQRMGRLEMTLDWPSDSATAPSIMLFYKGGDEDGVQKEFGYWERAYNKGLKCYEKAQIASQSGGTYIPLPGSRNVTTYADDDGREWTSVTVVTHMNTHRARWMFMSVGNCQTTCYSRFCANSLDIKYRLILTNGSGSDKFFSADQMWFWETAVAFFALYLALSVLALRTRAVLVSEQKYHHSVQLLMASIAASALGIVFQVVLYTRYATTGVLNPVIEGAGISLGLLAEFLLLLMTILVAKGWTIVRHKISALGRVRIAAYMTLYVVSSVGSWVYYVYFVDPADIVYVYETVPGAVFVSLRCVAFAWFTYAIGVTLRKYQQKRAFYKKFWFLVGCWILTLPFLVIVNSLVNVWFRAKVVNLISILSTFLCQAILCALYHPSLCGLNKNFPFHATTFAVSQGKSSKTDKTNIHGGNTFEEAHLLRAFELSSQMRHSVSMLQSYTSDLHTFLDDIRLKFKTQPADPAGDIEAGLGVPLQPRSDSSQSASMQESTGGQDSDADALERVLAAVVAPRASRTSIESNPVARPKQASFRELQDGLDETAAGAIARSGSSSSLMGSARGAPGSVAKTKRKSSTSGSSSAGGASSGRSADSHTSGDNEEGIRRKKSRSGVGSDSDDLIVPRPEAPKRSKSSSRSVQGKKKRSSATASSALAAEQSHDSARSQSKDSARSGSGADSADAAHSKRRQRRRSSSSSSRSNALATTLVDDGDL